MFRTLSYSAAVTLCLTAVAPAAIIDPASVVYDEFVSGDVGSGPQGINLGTLMIGDHTVIGSVTDIPPFPDNDVFDSYFFETAGEASILATGFGGPSLSGTAFLTGYADASYTGGTNLGAEFFDIPDTEVIFSDLDAGFYRLSLTAQGANAAYQYAATVSVAQPSAVPIPAAGLMLLAALGGIAALGRKARG